MILTMRSKKQREDLEFIPKYDFEVIDFEVIHADHSPLQSIRRLYTYCAMCIDVRSPLLPKITFKCRQHLAKNGKPRNKIRWHHDSAIANDAANFTKNERT